MIRYFFLYQPGASTAYELAFADGLPGLVFLPGAAGVLRFRTPRTRKVRQAGGLVEALLEGVYLDESTAGAPVLGVRFTPQGLHHLLQFPLHQLRGGVCWELNDVFGTDICPVLNCVRGNAPIGEQIGCIEQFMRGRLRSSIAPNALFMEAVERIKGAQGQLRVDELAHSLKVDYKWLERQFLRYLGISPKEFARSHRFLHAYFDLQQSHGRDAMGAAVRNGYYDQNHLGKEFKRFTLRSPLAYWQEQGNRLT